MLPKFVFASFFFQCTTRKSFPYGDHSVATAHQLAISPKTSLSFSSRTPLNHGQLSGFFFLFLLNDFRNSGNVLPHFAKESLHIFKLTRGTRIDQKQSSCNIVEHVVVVVVVVVVVIRLYLTRVTYNSNKTDKLMALKN